VSRLVARLRKAIDTRDERAIRRCIVEAVVSTRASLQGVPIGETSRLALLRAAQVMVRREQYDEAFELLATADLDDHFVDGTRSAIGLWRRAFETLAPRYASNTSVGAWLESLAAKRDRDVRLIVLIRAMRRRASR
jgi:hypothetical protein